MSNTIEFAKYLLGLRKATTSDTSAELATLAKLAAGKRYVVEVGVFEGVASKFLGQGIHPAGKLYLIDPYFHISKLEKLGSFSFARYIAKRTTQPWRKQVVFVRATSGEAAATLELPEGAELIFIDARHDYESVLEDFKGWATKLAPGGLLAFHDSRCCTARPDLTEGDGPVRLCAEIMSGQHGNWRVVEAVDSLTVIQAN